MQDYSINELIEKISADTIIIPRSVVFRKDVYEESKTLFGVVFTECVNDLRSYGSFIDGKTVGKMMKDYVMDMTIPDIAELYATNMISPDSFWSVLKSPDLFKDELDFYKLDHIQEGYMDLPNIVKYISGLVRQIPFWTEMVNLLNLDGINKDLQDFLLSMAKDYINVLDNDCKMKCIEIGG